MSDLISRADAIEAVRKELVCDGRHETHDKTCRFIADVILSALPSAKAVQVVRCKDCKSSRVYGKTTQWLACEDVMEGQATDPDGYCYLGKRREE